MKYFSSNYITSNRDLWPLHLAQRKPNLQRIEAPTNFRIPTLIFISKAMIHHTTSVQLTKNSENNFKRTTRYDEIMKRVVLCSQNRHRVNEWYVYTSRPHTTAKTTKRRFKAVFQPTKQLLRTNCTRDSFLSEGSEYVSKQRNAADRY